MRKNMITAAMVSFAGGMLPLAAVPALAETAVASGYSVESTTIGALLDDPGAKAILQKYLPDLVASPQIEMTRAVTLKQLQQFTGDKLTDDTLAQIQADLGKLPPKH